MSPRMGATVDTAVRLGPAVTVGGLGLLYYLLTQSPARLALMLLSPDVVKALPGAPTGLPPG
jgi:hypothetical protein